MAAVTSQDLYELPDNSYIPTRQPPQFPSSYPYRSPPAQYYNDAGNASDTGSLNTRTSRRRAGSWGSRFLRWNSSDSKTQLHSPQNSQSTGAVELAALKSAPPVTFITQGYQNPQAFNQQAQTVPEGGRKRSFSGGSRKFLTDGAANMLRKSSRNKAAELEKLEQERKARQAQPAPSLPVHNPLPGIDSFGGDNSYNTSSSSPRNFSRPGVTMPPSRDNSSSSPAYAIRPNPASSSPDSSRKTNGEYVSDPISRTESMTNRGRSSYASSVVGGNMSSPRRIRRRKDPTPFNVLVTGAKNSGKTSFISFLRHSLALPHHSHAADEAESTVGGTRSSFTSHYLETEMDGERVGLTIWDSAGLERNLVDLQLREMTSFVESKFEDTFAEEQKVVRSPGVKDTHIHCVFLILDPIRLDATVAVSTSQQKNGVGLSSVSGLDDELDLQVMRVLWGKTTVIPVISKADTLTSAHMAFLKRTVWDSIKAARLDPLEALELEDDTIEEGAEEDGDDSSSSYDDEEDGTPTKPKLGHKRQTSISTSIKSSDEEAPYIPMSILSPDPYDLPPYVKSKPSKSDKVGRRFPWGFADPYNAEHCDFTRLRDSIFVEWRGELRDLSRSKWYENWRTSRLKNVPGTKQRIKGGVTPVAAVPQAGRNFSSGSNGAAAVPRTVSQPFRNDMTAGAETRNGAYGNVPMR